MSFQLMMTNPPFHTISAKDVWDKLDTIQTAVTTAITRMEAQDEKLADNASRIKSLELKVYGIAAGLIAAVTIMVSGVLA